MNTESKQTFLYHISIHQTEVQKRNIKDYAESLDKFKEKRKQFIFAEKDGDQNINVKFKFKDLESAG